MRKNSITMKISTKKTNRTIAVFLTLILLCIQCSFLSVLGDVANIEIYSADDLLSFAKNCKLDSWSSGKTVLLMCDIDLTDSEFSCIPIFSGKFDGSGYTIKNFNNSQKGSDIGFFRYLANGAEVLNLNIEGTLTPNGSGKEIGGIVGKNSGRITNCNFFGSVKGVATVGGICGYNDVDGYIEYCYSQGNVRGNSYTGGICGQNFGTVAECENTANVNTVYEEEEKSIDEIKDEIKDGIENFGTTESVDSDTDTGGICGYNRGSISKCSNSGDVGYESIGYNIGGICGRTGGNIDFCRNSGKVFGRKDVGGICGQAEPYVMIEYSRELLSQMQATLAKIRDIVNNSNDSQIINRFNQINSSSKNVSDSMEILYDEAEVYADDVTERINYLTERLDTTVENSIPVFDGISEGITGISDSMEKLGKCLECANDSFEIIDNSINEMEQAYVNFDKGNTFLRNALKQISAALEDVHDDVERFRKGKEEFDNAIDDLTKALKTGKNIEKSFADLKDSLTEMKSGITDFKSAIDEIIKALEAIEDGNVIKEDLTNLITELKTLKESIDNIKAAMSDVVDALEYMAQSFDLFTLENASNLLYKGFGNMTSAMDEYIKALKKVKNALNELKPIEDKSKEAIGYANECVDGIILGTDKLNNSIIDLKKVVNDFIKEDKFEMPSVSDNFKAGVDDLKKSIENMRNEFSGLNADVEEKKNSIYDDVDLIGDQLDMLINVTQDKYYEKIKNPEKSDYFEDISETDTKETKGRVEKCFNVGEVNGDINVGGITGSMAIEYDFDPEDDAETTGDKSLNFKYLTKCVLRRNINEGVVSVKKKNGGGISGKSELGSVFSCGGFGSVIGQEAYCIGGIVGDCGIPIKSCSSKGELSGNDYVGGIAGKSDSGIMNCYSMPNVSNHGECVGSISGKSEISDLAYNYFINENVGGVDDISYQGRAENGDVESFIDFSKSNLDYDVKFSLKFIADNELIKTVSFIYKQPIPDSEIPDVPEKSGYYGKWADYDFKEPTYDADIYAKYKREADILSSTLKRGEKSIVLVCGAFDDNAGLFVDELNDKAGCLDAYSVKISGVYTDKYNVRYLPSKENKLVDLYVDFGNGQEKVNTKDYGSYLEFTVNSPEFKLYEKKKDYKGMIINAGILLLIILIAFVLIKLIRKNGSKLKINRKEDKK